MFFFFCVCLLKAVALYPTFLLTTRLQSFLVPMYIAHWNQSRNYSIRCSVQWAIGTRNPETTVLMSAGIVTCSTPTKTVLYCEWCRCVSLHASECTWVPWAQCVQCLARVAVTCIARPEPKIHTSPVATLPTLWPQGRGVKMKLCVLCHVDHSLLITD